MATTSLPQWLCALHQNNAQTITHELVGGKGKNLSVLLALGFTIPKSLVVTTLNPSLGFADKTEYFTAVADFSPQLPEYLPSNGGWAVRSSATIEDLAEQSQAGRFETVFIETPAQLAEAVNTVWESAASAGIDYRSMGVVIQPLINADASGVGFSVDPITNAATTVIELCPGRADQLVDGSITPTTLKLDALASIDTTTSSIDKAIANETLPPGINSQRLAELQEGIDKLEQHFGQPIDVEWAVEEGILYWLQVRPMTHQAPAIFQIPDAQKAQLKGLWVRIQHCFAPQMPLISTLNPGGYFNFEQWDSQLVNGFHYIQVKAKDNKPIESDNYEGILDAWDRFEAEQHKILSHLLAEPIDPQAPNKLWAQLNERIEIKRRIYTTYMDPDFLTIRDQLEAEVLSFLEKASVENPEATINRLAQQLESQSDHKQQQLMALASLPYENLDDLIATPQWQTFMEQFGFESANTQLFYLPTIAETPELLIDMLEGLKSNPLPPQHQQNNWQTEAQNITALLDTHTAQQFKHTLNLWRRCLKRTEDDDTLLQKATASIRKVLLAIGNKLTQDKMLKQNSEIFYLQASELQTYLLQGTNTITHQTLEERQHTFVAQKRLQPPAMIVNGRVMEPKAKANNNTLTGLAASPGMASGTVIIVNDPFSCHTRRFPKGSVIVAPLLCPAFAYSLVGCAALITEIGGLASHGAIVAREMGIPAVVGIKGARQLLKTGVTVAVDGSNGRVLLENI